MSIALRLLTFLFLSLLIWGCAGKTKKENIFSLFYSNRLDDFLNHIEKPLDPDLEFIINNKLLLQNKYTYSVQNDELVVCLKSDKMKCDTVVFGWDDEIGKLSIGHKGVLKMYSHEKEIRRKLAIDNIKKKDYQKALAWLCLNDTIKIDSLLGDIYFKLDDLGKAFPYLDKAYSSGHVNSGIALSFIYTFSGKRDKAIVVLKEMAKKNNSEAMVELGDYYETYFSDFGYDPPKGAKTTSSFLWYRKAASLNNLFAMYKLGWIYEEEINRDLDLDSAYYWYKKSSDLGFSVSTIEIAHFFLEGKYKTQSLDSGMYWMWKAITQDPVQGYSGLGTIYEDGIGVEANNELALKYYMRADSLGSPVAKVQLARVKKKMAGNFKNL